MLTSRLIEMLMDIIIAIIISGNWVVIISISLFKFFTEQSGYWLLF